MEGSGRYSRCWERSCVGNLSPSRLVWTCQCRKMDNQHFPLWIWLHEETSQARSPSSTRHQEWIVTVIIIILVTIIYNYNLEGDYSHVHTIHADCMKHTGGGKIRLQRGDWGGGHRDMAAIHVELLWSWTRVRRYHYLQREPQCK